MPHPDPQADPALNAREMAIRATVAVGLLGVGLIHLIDSIGKYSETRYLFWMYMALILGCLTLAGALLFSRSRLTLPAAAALVAGALIGFVLNRTVGLPNATGDIGNWTEPIGLANVFVEGSILAIALPALLLARRTASAPARRRTPSASAVPETV